mgnify:CR=1 FL=1
MIGVGLIPMEFSLGPLAPEHLEEFIVGLVLAIIVAVGVQKIAVPKFEQMFNERANAIEGGINRAQVIQQEAEETKRHYQEQLAQEVMCIAADNIVEWTLTDLRTGKPLPKPTAEVLDALSPDEFAWVLRMFAPETGEE